MSLTRGVIKEIVCCSNPEDLPISPVVQILGMKREPLGAGEQDRYRLVLSDGLNYYTYSMLGPQLNHLVQENVVEVKAVIQMNRYTCNIIQEGRKIIILLELVLVKKASEVEGKIGEPTQLSDLLTSLNNNTIMPLTRGVIKEIVYCSNPEDLPINPVVQILGMKKEPPRAGGQDQYRLVLSDGVNYYTCSMLDTQLNHLVRKDVVEVKAVIQMNRYNCNVIQERKKIIILMELTIIQKASKVWGMMGEPTQLSDPPRT